MSVVEFQPWPKIGRLNRDIVITEKIDGSNAAVHIDEQGFVTAQSRTRLISPADDNFGFARWAITHQAELAYDLGPGLHFGEWWGGKIQRGYGRPEKTFSLFNARRFGLAEGHFSTPQLAVVPVLYEGPFSDHEINEALRYLASSGSVAAPGFMRPEGVVVFHTATSTMFKVTLEGDAQPKGQAA